MTHDNFILIRKHLAAMYAEMLAPYVGEYKDAHHLLTAFQIVDDFTHDLKEIVTDLGTDQMPFVKDHQGNGVLDRPKQPIDYAKLYGEAMANLTPSDAL